MTAPAPNSPAATYARYGHTPVTVSNTNASTQQLVTGIGLITAISARAISATTAPQFELHDGTDSTGNILANICMAAGGGMMSGAGFPGIYFGRGLYLLGVSGFAQVTVTYIPLTEPLR